MPRTQTRPRTEVPTKCQGLSILKGTLGQFYYQPGAPGYITTSTDDRNGSLIGPFKTPVATAVGAREYWLASFTRLVESRDKHNIWSKLKVDNRDLLIEAIACLKALANVSNPKVVAAIESIQ